MSGTAKPETIWQAAARGNTERMKEYIENKGLLTEPDEFKLTLLHHAVHGGQAEVVDLLIAAGGVNLDAADNDGRTALSVACDKGFIDIVAALLKAGADGSVKDTFKRSCLHMAGNAGRADVIKLLLDEADISGSAKTVASWLPLHYAAANGHLDACAALKPTKNHLTATASSQTARDMAEANGHKEVAEYLASLSAA
ncbi:26S proteasome non-ATPase regulatory subunit 10 [Diplonema papillatum]|nr:26S proteasome non-ATPase regulatory subunit 10 [Diplonema papillatum]|eukprot:gene13516-20815_t